MDNLKENCYCSGGIDCIPCLKKKIDEMKLNICYIHCGPDCYSGNCSVHQENDDEIIQLHEVVAAHTSLHNIRFKPIVTKGKKNMFEKILERFKKGLKGMAGFAGVMFSFIGELGFLTRNRSLTVFVAFLMVALGLTVQLTLSPVFFYAYIAVIFAAGIMIKGYNSARSNDKSSEAGNLSLKTNTCEPT